jgi:hypothetical protein
MSKPMIDAQFSDSLSIKVKSKQGVSHIHGKELRTKHAEGAWE